MSKTKKYVLAGLGFLLLLGVFVFDRPQVAAQQTKPPQQVQVMNAAGTAPGQNVPISGSVGISGTPNVAISGTPNVNAAQSGAWTVGVTGTPSVNALQGGSWNVGINGTPNVNVANTAQQPIPVSTRATGTPFAHEVFFAMPLGSSFAFSGFTPSATQPLLIETFTFVGTTSTGQTLGASITCTTNGVAVSHFIQLQRMGASSTAGQDAYIATLTALNLYVDANTQVVGLVFRNSTLNAGGANYGQSYTISGRLL